MSIATRLLVILSIIPLRLSASVSEPPRLFPTYNETVAHGQINQTIRLECPVESSSKLLFDWTKDDESISSAWTKFEKDGPYLIIEDLESDDSGVYKCIAINGYGSQEAAIRLIVIDPSFESFTPVDAADEYANLGSEFKELNFTEDTYQQQKYIRVTSGSSLRIRCSVVGYPIPELMWIKNEVVYARPGQNQLEETETGALHLPLAIDGATGDSSGNYTCLARGLKKDLQISFVIKVLDAKKNIPEMTEVEPHNTTERRGGTGKLHCWIYSLAAPEAEWFKMLPPAGDYRQQQQQQQLHPNTSLVIGRHQYQIQESNETVKKHDGSFLRQLIVYPLDDKDTGCYLCVASNKFGYNMRRTCLIVEPNYDTNESKSVPFSVMVALPSGLILSLAAGFVCWLKERERLRRLEAAPAGQQQPQQQQQQQTEAATSALARQTGRPAESGSPPGRAGVGRQTLMSGPGSHHQLDHQQQAPGPAAAVLDGCFLVSATPGGSSTSTDGGYGYDLHRMARAADQANYYFDNQQRRCCNVMRNNPR